jgi:hypothetical protein
MTPERKRTLIPFVATNICDAKSLVTEIISTML